ncbi:ubiquinol--cytochrome-c reductase catalytic subunit rip1 [Coelomomyces lativittatus]|nr:ubiquinol--cytochrome-c reductase catalytic subunit rip1 [Coelomomyces lativittatus]
MLLNTFRTKGVVPMIRKSLWMRQIYIPTIMPTTSMIPSEASQTYSSDYSTTKIPDFSKVKTPNTTSDASFRTKNYAYFMIGATGMLGGMAAKNTVHDFVSSLAAGADILSLAKLEVDLTSIPEGKNVVLKWRGKPVFIRHRTSQEIDEANSIPLDQLKDPQLDADRVQQPAWLVMLGICTHLGCVPVGESGDFGGWYCPCHGSHYDISGRIRKGPAPSNLEIPPYNFIEDGSKIVIG